MIPQILGRTGRHHMPAQAARARPEVDHVVSRLDGLRVVFHHDDRVSQIAQPAESGDEAQVVALVQADGGLVENVHDARQFRADLRGQPDPLRLAA